MYPPSLHSNNHHCSVQIIQAFFKMHFTHGLITLATLITVAVASGTPPAPIPPSQCNTGPIQCCQSTGFADEPALSNILATLGIDVQDLNVFLGATCSPISVIGLPGSSWSVIASSGGGNGAYHFHCLAPPSRSAAPITASVSISHKTTGERLKVFVTKRCLLFISDGVIAIGCTPINVNL